MDKYIIVNRDSNQIVCKGKNSSRHYRQSIGYVSKDCVVLQTTKGRAEKERDYLNQEYNKGWEIEKVAYYEALNAAQENGKRMGYERGGDETIIAVLKYLDNTIEDINREKEEEGKDEDEDEKYVRLMFADAIEEVLKLVRNDLARIYGIEWED